MANVHEAREVGLSSVGRLLLEAFEVQDRTSLADLPLSFFLFQSVPHGWYTKGFGMYYPLCGMVHIKDPLHSVKKNIPLIAAVGFLCQLSMCFLKPYV